MPAGFFASRRQKARFDAEVEEIVSKGFEPLFAMIDKSQAEKNALQEGKCNPSHVF
jgi:hypothetical protein